jgi:hypothetical protein
MDICLGDNLRFDNECHKFCFMIFSNKKINDILLIKFSPLKIDRIVDKTIYFLIGEEHLLKLFPLFKIIDEKIMECVKGKRVNMSKFIYMPIKSLLISEDKYLKIKCPSGTGVCNKNDTIDCVFWIRKIIIDEKEAVIVPDVILY